jgi:hypothetical protein
LHYVTGIRSNRAMGVCTRAVQIYICVYVNNAVISNQMQNCSEGMESD